MSGSEPATRRFARACILRSPPFPGTDAATAAISFPAEAECRDPDEDELARAVAVAEAIAAAKVGGRFWQPPLDLGTDRPALFCPADAATVRDMLGEVGLGAVAVLPPAPWAKAAASAFAHAGCRAVHIGDHDPWSLIDAAGAMHFGADDERIILALAAGVPLRIWGQGRYQRAGDDPAWLLHDALIAGASYRDCFSDAPATAESAIGQLAFWRRQIDANRQIAAACGIAEWKRDVMTRFLWAGRDRKLLFTRNAHAAVDSAASQHRAVAVWPSRAPRQLEPLAAERQVPVHQIEDGFIRSVGLGSGLHPPLSVVVDREGIYYDPSRPSDLETILATTRFDPQLIARADAMIGSIVAHGISKYASGRGPTVDRPRDRRCVLVPGQVEDDRSVQLGGGDVSGNLDLLRRVRAAEPGAHILFKPHPDVEAGHRQGRVADAEVLRHADAIVRDAAMAALLDAVDAVHVWTSLAGFEALLRGREVITHGSPFYAGWGLTRDLGAAIPRRMRHLSLPELVAGALILYPRYLDPVTLLPCHPETLIARMAQPGIARESWLTRLRQWQGRLRAGLAGVRA